MKSTKNKHGFTVKGKLANGKEVELCQVYQSRDARDTIYELLLKQNEIDKKYVEINKVEK